MASDNAVYAACVKQCTYVGGNSCGRCAKKDLSLCLCDNFLFLLKFTISKISQACNFETVQGLMRFRYGLICPKATMPFLFLAYMWFVKEQDVNEEKYWINLQFLFFSLSRLYQSFSTLLLFKKRLLQSRKQNFIND